MAIQPGSEVSPRIQEARKNAKFDPAKAESSYREILSTKPAATPKGLSEYEAALIGLGETYQTQKKWEDLAELVKSSTSSLTSFPKSKTAKIGQSISNPCS